MLECAKNPGINLISKTPYRVSFAGGGTDLPHWASKYGGAVISTTIDKFCYITCKKLPSFYDYKYHLDTQLLSMLSIFTK